MFITIDGPDGVGKTTAAHALVERINSQNKRAIYTAEPTNSEIGQEIRRILRDGTDEKNRLTDLFVLDREDHLNNFILPTIANGTTVVCDRYKYSTICYQHLQGERIEILLNKNSGFLKPDFAFILLTNDVDTLLERIGNRGQEKDLFETRTVLQKALAIYRDMGNYFPNENIVFLSADTSTSSIVSEMMCAIEQ